MAMLLNVMLQFYSSALSLFLVSFQLLYKYAGVILEEHQKKPQIWKRQRHGDDNVSFDGD